MRNYRNDNERFDKRYDREERGNYNGHNSSGNRQDRYGQEGYQDESRSYGGAFGRGEERGSNQQGYNQQGFGRQGYNQQGSGQHGYNRQGADHDYRREESRDWQGGQRYDRGHGEGYHNLETEYGDNSRSGSENRGQYDYDRNSRGNSGQNNYGGQYDYENNNRNRGGNYNGGYGAGNSENYSGGRNYGGEGNYGNSGNYGGGNNYGNTSPTNTDRGSYMNAGSQYGNQQQANTNEQYGQRRGSSNEYPRYNEQSRQGEYGRGNYNDNYMREEERGYSQGPSSSNSSYTDAGYEGQYNRSDRSDSVFGMGPRSGRGTRGW